MHNVSDIYMLPAIRYMVCILYQKFKSDDSKKREKKDQLSVPVIHFEMVFKTVGRPRERELATG